MAFQVGAALHQIESIQYGSVEIRIENYRPTLIISHVYRKLAEGEQATRG